MKTVLCFLVFALAASAAEFPALSLLVDNQDENSIEIPKVRKLVENDMKALEKQLDAAGAPYAPGRLLVFTLAASAAELPALTLLVGNRDENWIEIPKLRKLVESDMKALEKQLDAAGAPYTPGRLPDWKK
jgi:hypothetical protein